MIINFFKFNETLEIPKGMYLYKNEPVNVIQMHTNKDGSKTAEVSRKMNRMNPFWVDYNELKPFKSHLQLPSEEEIEKDKINKFDYITVDQLIDIRKEARENKDWDLSDEIRDYLDKKYIFIFDTKDGQEVHNLNKDFFQKRKFFTNPNFMKNNRKFLEKEIKKEIDAEKRHNAWVYSQLSGTKNENKKMKHVKLYESFAEKNFYKAIVNKAQEEGIDNWVDFRIACTSVSNSLLKSAFSGFVSFRPANEETTNIIDEVIKELTGHVPLKNYLDDDKFWSDAYDKFLKKYPSWKNNLKK